MNVLDLIESVGVYTLISNDGCACGSFSVHGVAVDVSCGRGGDRAIRVFRTMADCEEDLEPIAAEVKRQIDASYGRDFPVIFEAYPDSREYRALDAWRAAPGNPRYEDFIKTFEIHERGAPSPDPPKEN